MLCSLECWGWPRPAQVSYPKNALTRVLGKHKVGQYYFINFPELSLTEWYASRAVQFYPNWG